MLQDSPAECPASFSLGEDERWYVVRTQPHREMQAARQVENQAYRVFYPRFFKSRRHARKFETVLAPWRDFDVAFIVPPDNCPAQYVTLALDARSTSETFVSGSI